MTIEQYYEHKNIINLQHLGFVLLMPIIIDFTSVLTQQFGILSSSLTTMIVYGGTLVVIIYRLLHVSSAREIVNDMLWLGILYFPFIVNFLFFSNTREMLISQDMLIIYIFFIPISVFSIRKITNWNIFFETLVYPGYYAVGIAIFILLFLDYQRYLVYMGFSYSLLPFICNFYYMARTHNNEENKKNVLYGIFFFIGLVAILAFGARAAVSFALLYIIIYEILRSGIKLSYKLITWGVLIIIIAMLWNNVDVIANKLVTIDIFRDSYLLKNFLSGKLFESASRTLLYEACRERISTVGITVAGFFGDRQYCLGYAYPHNIIYEMLMSFGWGIGMLIIIVYMMMIFCGIVFNDKKRREVVIFIIITMLARYLISGSYLIEGKFWILTTLLISITFKKRRKKRKWIQK